MPGLKPAVSKKDHQTGNIKAKVVLVEYGDYQCPHCGVAHPYIKQLLREFDKELHFVFRNFPLQESHPAAMISAVAAEAADKQDKFWPMHDMIFEHQDELSENSLFEFAESLGLDIGIFTKDMKSEELFSRVETDFESGVRSGVNGTPSFFINGAKLDSYDESYKSLADAVKRV